MTSGETANECNFDNFPCHTQALERCVKVVTKESQDVVGFKNRDGFIRNILISTAVDFAFEVFNEGGTLDASVLPQLVYCCDVNPSIDTLEKMGYVKKHAYCMYTASPVCIYKVFQSSVAAVIWKDKDINIIFN
ncbi:unnamed protein product [Callosobruchus maculatus]|uniref:Uncharacterized protein n=1 Tax=Callosobruchus maculatus TaxID=64391 RepID=A0A653BU94_CALMS|nr:unnamed protein product [Callosobruchus maculatus]